MCVASHTVHEYWVQDALKMLSNKNACMHCARVKITGEYQASQWLLKVVYMNVGTYLLLPQTWLLPPRTANMINKWQVGTSSMEAHDGTKQGRMDAG
jgi:hypothetical protein